MNRNTALIIALVVCCTASFIVGRTWPAAGSDSASDPSSRALVGPRTQDGSVRGPRLSRHSDTRHGSPSDHHGSDRMLAQIESILNTPDRLARSKAWANYLQGLDADQLAEVASRMGRSGFSEIREHELCMLMEAWAAHDPLAAMAHADRAEQEKSVDTKGRGPALQMAVLESWARADPEAAIEWTKGRPYSGWFDPWPQGVINGLAATDPDRATRLLEENSGTIHPNSSITSLSAHYLTQGPDAAREWAMGLEDDMLRQVALSKVMSKLAVDDPKACADWLLANGDDAKHHSISSVMTIMARDDLQSAFAYHDQIKTDERARNSALDGIANAMAKSDPQGVFDLIDANPGMNGITALHHIKREYEHSDPEMAKQAQKRISALFGTPSAASE